MTITGTIIEICWIILLVVWTAGAFYQKRTKNDSKISKKLRDGILMIAAIFFLVRYDFISIFSYVIMRTTDLVNILSIALYIIGLVIAIWARITLGGNWSARVVVKKGHELIVKGPYRFVRHPIYTGFLSLFLGTAIAIGRIGGFIGFIVLLIGFTIKYKEEEKLMTKTFGREYIEYKKKVRALVPFIY